MVTLTYGFGVALAAVGGVLAAPIYSVNPQMGTNLIIVVFAVVVIGGMGSILGSIITGFGARHRRGADQGLLAGSLGHRHFRHHGDRAARTSRRPVREGLSMADTTSITARRHPGRRQGDPTASGASPGRSSWRSCAMVTFLAVSPFVLYPVFLMKLLCFALFACAFNLLIGYVGLLSFGHAAYFGMGGYLAGHAAKAWGLTPEVAIIIGGLAAAAARRRSPAGSPSAARASTSP